MLIKRNTIEELDKIFSTINNLVFNIETQYKLLKIKKKIKEEIEIAEEQINSLLENYAEKDVNNNFIISEQGGIKIQEEFCEVCQQKISEINNLSVQIPDIYFSLDELKELNLSFYQLEILEPFIKL